MQRTDGQLFQIGEVAKMLGVTRRMLLNYEDHGLVTPAYKNEQSGYRYYTADNIVHIRIIRSLQDLGLSLAEIRDYFENTQQINEQIGRLTELRDRLDNYIAQLRLRLPAKDEPEIRREMLPGFTAFCRPFDNADLTQRTDELRQTYVDAVRHYPLDLQNRMCVQVPINDAQEGLYIVPVKPDSQGENIRRFAAASAISVYYRGAYENFPAVHEQLLRYAAENGMTPHGFFRHVYMEGPPTHGANKDAYITQIALPIKFAALSPEQ